MAVHVKSLDWKHLPEVVLEGFLQLASESEFRQFAECQSRELRATIRNSLHPQRPARSNRFLYVLCTPIAIDGKAHHSYSISIFKPPIRLPWKKLLLRCSVLSCSACEQGVLTRVNTITKVAYRDASTILSGEHINEPCCESDQSGYQFAGPWVFLSPELHFSLFS